MSTIGMEDRPATSDRPKLEQAAIILLGVGEQNATRILRSMSAKAVSQMMQEIPRIAGVVESELEAIMSGMLQESDDAPLFNDKSGMNLALRRTLGEKRAGELLQNTPEPEHIKVLERLLLLEPLLITRLISNEHPQLQAITLACLEPAKSSAVLARMPERVQVDLVRRLAGLKAVPTSSLDAIAGLLESLSEQEVSTYSIHGVGQLAEMLNHLDAEAGDQLLEELRVDNEDLAEKVSALRFTFEHVLELEIEALRVLVDSADMDVLALALRGAPQSRQEYIYSCLGKRSAAALREEIETGNSVRASRVKEARDRVTALARNLARTGQIELVSSTEEMVS